MNCDGVSNLLSAYLDGELSPGELLRVEEHLRRCHACADEVDSLRQTIALVTSLEEVEVPASFQAQLHERLVALGPPMAAVRRTPAAPAWQRNARRWAIPAAAAAAVLAIGLSTYPKGQLPGLDGGTSRMPNQLAVETPGNSIQSDHGPAQSSEQVATTDGPKITIPPVTNVTPGPDQNTPKVTDTTPKPGTNPAPPGRTNTQDGPKTVVQDPVAPVEKLPAQYVYAYTATVTGALDAKTEAMVRSEYALVQPGENALMITIPADDASRAKALTQIKGWWPTAVVTEAKTDNAAAIAAADVALTAAKRNLEADQQLNAPAAQIDVDKQDLAAKQESHDRLVAQTTSAVITLQFQPAH